MIVALDPSTDRPLLVWSELDPLRGIETDLGMRPRDFEIVRSWRSDEAVDPQLAARRFGGVALVPWPPDPATAGALADRELMRIDGLADCRTALAAWRTARASVSSR